MNNIEKWDLQTHDNWIRKVIESTEVDKSKNSEEKSEQVQISIEDSSSHTHSGINSASTIIDAVNKAITEDKKNRSEQLEQRAKWLKTILSDDIEPKETSLEFSSQQIINALKKSRPYGQKKTPEEKEASNRLTKEKKRLTSALFREKKQEELVHLLEENTRLKDQINQSGELDSEIEEQYLKLREIENIAQQAKQQAKATRKATKTSESSEELAAKKERHRQYVARTRAKEKDFLMRLKKINELSKKQLRILSGKSAIEDDKTNKRKGSEEESHQMQIYPLNSGEELKQHTEWLKTILSDENVESTETPSEFSSQQQLMIQTPEEKEASNCLKNEKKRLRSAQSRKDKKAEIDRLYKENTDLKNQINQTGKLDSEIEEYYNKLLEMGEIVQQSMATRGRKKGSKKPPESPEELEAKKERHRQSAARSREREKTLLLTLQMINDLSKKQLQTLSHRSSGF